MKLDQINLELDNSRLNINLKLYKILKDVVKDKLTSHQTIQLIEKLKILIASKEEYLTKLETLYQGINDLSTNSNTRLKIKTLLDNSIIEEKDFHLLKLALNLNRFKGLILEKSKLISESFRVTEDIHIMDFAYDYKMLYLPYSVRVSGALLIKVLFEKIRLNQNKLYQPIIDDLKKFIDLDPDTILQIIYAESASQSIRSKSGAGYEKRFEEILKNNSIKYQGQTFDSNVNAVEYDFKLLRNNKSIGVSVKRTLRERYKQNHEEIENLDVDKMFLVTLGIDLNEAKVLSILQKENHFIFVASDIYTEKEFLYNTERVFPIDELNNQFIDSIFDENY